jgi:hypothetical protein
VLCSVKTSYRGRRSRALELPEELRQLCEVASKEMDPEKLFALVAEINRLFQEYEREKKQIDKSLS